MLEKGHLQEAGQPRGAELRVRRVVAGLRFKERSDNRWWSMVLRKRSCNHRRRKIRRVSEGGAVQGGREAKGDRGGGLEGWATVDGLGA